MSVNRFKQGDLVRVREDLKVGKSYGGWHFNSDMEKLKGRVFKIRYKIYDHYELEVTGWGWTDEMFEIGIAFADNDTSVKEDNNVVFDKNIDDLFSLYKS